MFGVCVKPLKIPDYPFNAFMFVRVEGASLRTGSHSQDGHAVIKPVWFSVHY